MCLYPKLIKNKKYTLNKKNGGVIPAISDERTLYVPVGCGKCIECMKQKKRNWQIRMLEEIKENTNGKFVTLTFNDKALEELEKDVEIQSLTKILENEVATLAVRRFLERWRKKHKKSVRHWLVTELGHENTERIHLHGIIFTDNVNDIEKIWQYGNVWIGNYVNAKTINYIIKYVNKLDTDHKGYIPKVLCSKGIGSKYLKRYDSTRNKFNGEKTIEYYQTSSGDKINLPTYYRNKIYTDEEREKLWLMMLDKEERYVCGNKVSIKDTQENYEKLLKFYRAKNERLGYGDDSKTWSKEEYDKNREKLRSLRKYNESKRNTIKGQHTIKSSNIAIDNKNNEFNN